jgi:spore maturation protein CgeB
MYEVLARSRIVINRHGPVAAGYANNMRLFEATGAGAMLVTEAAPNLPDYFEPGREVVTYEGPDELIEKLRYYLEHDEERKRIAAAGQGRTLRDHTYAKVIGRLSQILEARRGRL